MICFLIFKVKVRCHMGLWKCFDLRKNLNHKGHEGHKGYWV